MWWILTALLVLIAWALWYVLSLSFEIPMWIPIVATSVLAALAIFLLVLRRIRARRAATALERAIAQQGAQQVMNARPERRAEIQELQRQVQGGIAALKQSKLGTGKKGGAGALYSLPWYVIIGPPGAGKTTALKHSGLVFPFAEAGGSGGAVRGVGGTRNCDWWFTNEAILLDTAGRFMTEQDDHDEWMAFLQLLLKYRSKQPINGVLVAVSIADIIDANEQQIEALGKKLRARVDEVMTQLHMVMPVYVLFTKCDLIAGFTEFFGDVLKNDRKQAWGATFKLDQPKLDPAKLFEGEFDILTKQVHARALKRFATERSREAREKIFQFPLEFAGVKRNLADLIGTLFMVNAFQGTPTFRGFYFTSGTQEGRPLDRVLARMGQAMGIRTAEATEQQVVESKSYFLYDVFSKIVFPDGSLAARSKSEIRRQQLMRVAVSAAALTLAVIVAIPSIFSYLTNRALLADTEDRAKAAGAITWDGQPPSAKLKLLAPVLERLTELDGYRDDLPFSMGFLMYRGEEIYRPTMKVYVSLLQQGFVVPCKQKLELELRAAKGDAYLKERTSLKTYLMLSDIEHLDVDWATVRLTALWAQILRPTSDLPEFELKKQLGGHVRYYLTLLKDKKVTPIPPDADLIEKTRKTLQGVTVAKRYYDQFVNVLIDEKYDAENADMEDKPKYPPFSLVHLLDDKPAAKKLITSALFAKEKRYKEVEGPYTEKGHYDVLLNVAEGGDLLLREEWIVPLGPDERGDQVVVHLKRLAEDYDTRYINAWNDWMADVTVQPPANLDEAVELYRALTEPEWAYLRILRNVQDNTIWKREPPVPPAATKRLNQAAEQAILRRTKLRVKVDLQKVGERLSTVPGSFKRTVEFGVPPDSPKIEGAATASIVDTPLSKYIALIEKLRGDMLDLKKNRPGVDVRVLNANILDAARATQTLLQPFDDRARTLLEPLLLNPLKVGGIRLPPSPGGRFR